MPDNALLSSDIDPATIAGIQPVSHPHPVASDSRSSAEFFDRHVATIHHVHCQTVSIKQRHADKGCSCCLRNQYVFPSPLPNDTGQVDVQSDDAAVGERSASMTGEAELQHGQQAGWEREITVVARIDDGLDLLRRLTRAGDFKFDDRFAIAYSAADHPCSVSVAICPPRVYAVGYPIRKP